MAKHLTRRDFLKQAAAGAGGLLWLAACGKAPGAASQPSQPVKQASTSQPTEEKQAVTNASRAKQTYDMLVKRFGVPNTQLFFEHVQIQSDDRAYSYLWPYSSVISAANALAEMQQEGQAYHEQVKLRLDGGLNAYYDKNSDPTGYDSYILSAGGGDKFYDDNEWLGLDFVWAYRTLKDPAYLEKAKEIWRLTISGWAEAMGGGILWKQNDPEATRNTCSNGPAAVLALLLYQETKDQQYLDWAKKIMQWLAPLKSPDTGVYWDHVKKDGSLDKRTYTYNTGTPLHANALLYAITGEARYLDEARALAKASYEYFAKADAVTGQRFYPDTPWFNAILLRGYIALYAVDPARDRQYIDAVQQNVDYAWENARAADGAFSNDWTGRSGVTSDSHALIDQGAMAEIYARLSQFKA